MLKGQLKSKLSMFKAFLWFMVFNDISVILKEETEVLGETHRPLTSPMSRKYNTKVNRWLIIYKTHVQVGIKIYHTNI